MNIILLVLTLLFLPYVANGETASLKSGKVLDGEIVEKTNVSIKLNIKDQVVNVPLNMLGKDDLSRLQKLENF